MYFANAHICLAALAALTPILGVGALPTADPEPANLHAR